MPPESTLPAHLANDDETKQPAAAGEPSVEPQRKGKGQEGGDRDKPQHPREAEHGLSAGLEDTVDDTSAGPGEEAERAGPSAERSPSGPRSVPPPLPPRPDKETPAPAPSPSDQSISDSPPAPPPLPLRRGAGVASAGREARGEGIAPKRSAETRPEKPARDEPGKPRTVPPDAYRADAGSVQTARWLALLLGVVVLFSTVPALKHWNLEIAPPWARVVLIVAAFQAIYLAWMAATADWSSLWVVMLVFAGVSALYGMASAMAIASPLDQPIALGMGEIRRWAGRWCVSVLLLMLLVTYLAGRYASRWRRRSEIEVSAHLKSRAR